MDIVILKIEEFRKRVEEGHKEDLKGRRALEQHMKSIETITGGYSR